MTEPDTPRRGGRISPLFFLLLVIAGAMLGVVVFVVVFVPRVA